MTDNSRPTRAEVSDVANAIYDSASGIMLSGETAVGKYPVDCVKMMAVIALKTEADLAFNALCGCDDVPKGGIEPTKALASAALSTAYSLQVAAIVPLTTSGYSARLISRLRPKMGIIAATESRRTFFKMSLYWGVQPYLYDPKNVDAVNAFPYIVEKLEEDKILQKGVQVVLLGGSPVGTSGTTNVLRVSSIGNIATRGKIISKGRVEAKVHVYKSDKMTPDGHILVLRYLLEEDLSLVKGSLGIILQGSKGEDLARIAGKTLNIPVISCAEGASELLYDNERVVLDANEGLVFRS